MSEEQDAGVTFGGGSIVWDGPLTETFADGDHVGVAEINVRPGSAQNDEIERLRERVRHLEAELAKYTD